MLLKCICILLGFISLIWYTEVIDKDLYSGLKLVSKYVAGTKVNKLIRTDQHIHAL